MRPRPRGRPWYRAAWLPAVIALGLDAAAARAQDIPGVFGDASGGPPPGGNTPGGGGLDDSARGSRGSSLGGGVAPTGGLSPTMSPEALFGLADDGPVEVLSLEELWSRAAQGSFDLRIAHEKVVQQQAQVRRAWSFLLPNVSLGGSYTYNCTFGRADALADCGDQTVEFVSEEQLDQQALLFRALGQILGQVAELEDDPATRTELSSQSEGLLGAADQLERRKESAQPIVVQPAHVFGGSLQVTMPVFNGRSLPLLQNAYAAVDAVSLANRQASNALLLAVTRAYYTAATAKKMVQIAAAQQESSNRHRAAVQSRGELDALPPLQLRRAELDVIRAEQALRQAEAGYRGAIASVGQLAGIRNRFDIEEPARGIFRQAPRGEEELFELARAARPELRAQKIALQIAERSRLDAWMSFLPSVNLVGQARATSNVSGFIASPVQGALLLTASLPLYDGGARYAALEESASRIREALLQIRQVEDRILGQVRGNLEQVTLRSQALTLAEAAVSVARETQSQASALYEAGAATALDVSDANLGLSLAEAELARAQLDLEQADLGLAYVTGTFPREGPAPAPLRPEEEAAARQILESLAEGPASD
ncbi:MAG: TolC family protein [Myxococcota bacterium]